LPFLQEAVHLPLRKTIQKHGIENLKNTGVKVAYERYKNAGHGSGLGTDATGWLYKAVDFCKSKMN
jgi:hypothetical protein